jgi:hypothetical protein
LTPRSKNKSAQSQPFGDKDSSYKGNNSSAKIDEEISESQLAPPKKTSSRFRGIQAKSD